MFRRTCKWHHAELSRACEEDALGELDEEEVASATGRAQSLAKEALAFLHREQCHQRALQEAIPRLLTARLDLGDQPALAGGARGPPPLLRAIAMDAPSFG